MKHVRQQDIFAPADTSASAIVSEARPLLLQGAEDDESNRWEENV
jgi:hypothetical protein